MTLTAFCRKSPQVPRVCWLGSWAMATSDGGRQEKSAAFGAAHVVGGVDVLAVSGNSHAVAPLQIVSEINAARAVGQQQLTERRS
jgi:hypothetical protein